MPKNASIPLLTASGSYYEVGHAIGRFMKPHLEAIQAQAVRDLADKASWEDVRQRSRLYLQYAREAFPQYVTELTGIADGAEIAFEDLFVTVCQELWDEYLWGLPNAPHGKGCTDLTARGRASADGSTLLGHTNDESPGFEDHLVILKIQAEDEPEILGVSSGGAILSAGFNAAGIGLTGNQVFSNDSRPGVPRELMVRAILASTRLGEALDICALPERASNYNNIVADASGEVFSMEGSATDIEAIYIEEDILAHANHYVSPPMRAFEADRSDLSHSLIRHHRAWRLLRESYGQIGVETMMAILKDHVNYPASICMHGLTSCTAFSMVIQLDQLRCWIGKGRPCETQYVEYRLEPWEGKRVVDR